MKAIIIFSGIGFCLLLTYKLLLHIHLDYLHGKNINRGFSLALPFEYAFPYKDEVRPEYLYLKKRCNILAKLWPIFLAVNIVFGVLSSLL